MATSAGILLYRNTPGLEVLLVHPGGPFWASKDEGAWSIPKGEFDPAVENPLDAARREFREELGVEAPTRHVLELGEITQKAGKRVVAFAVPGDLDPSAIASTTFEMEWPPHSGRVTRFPEVDRAAWLSLPDARVRVNAAQAELLDRLVERLP